MVTYPHGHRCPYCQQDIPCHAALHGGCLFPPPCGITCEDCQHVVVAMTRKVG